MSWQDAAMTLLRLAWDSHTLAVLPAPTAVNTIGEWNVMCGKALDAMVTRYREQHNGTAPPLLSEKALAQLLGWLPLLHIVVFGITWRPDRVKQRLRNFAKNNKEYVSEDVSDVEGILDVDGESLTPAALWALDTCQIWCGLWAPHVHTYLTQERFETRRQLQPAASWDKWSQWMRQLCSTCAPLRALAAVSARLQTPPSHGRNGVGGVRARSRGRTGGSGGARSSSKEPVAKRQRAASVDLDKDDNEEDEDDDDDGKHDEEDDDDDGSGTTDDDNRLFTPQQKALASKPSSVHMLGTTEQDVAFRVARDDAAALAAARANKQQQTVASPSSGRPAVDTSASSASTPTLERVMQDLSTSVRALVDDKVRLADERAAATAKTRYDAQLATLRADLDEVLHTAATAKTRYDTQLATLRADLDEVLHAATHSAKLASDVSKMLLGKCNALEAVTADMLSADGVRAHVTATLATAVPAAMAEVQAQLLAHIDLHFKSMIVPHFNAMYDQLTEALKKSSKPAAQPFSSADTTTHNNAVVAPAVSSVPDALPHADANTTMTTTSNDATLRAGVTASATTLGDAALWPTGCLGPNGVTSLSSSSVEAPAAVANPAHAKVVRSLLGVSPTVDTTGGAGNIAEDIAARMQSLPPVHLRVTPRLPAPQQAQLAPAATTPGQDVTVTHPAASPMASGAVATL